MRRLGLLAVLPGLALAGSAAAAPDPYAATRSRPLFSSTRRPLPSPAVAPKPAAEPPAAQPPPLLALSGVILGPGTSVALLTRPGSPEAMRVALGARVDGWRVSEIRPRAVVLTLDDHSVTVTLPDAGAPRSPLNPNP